MLRALYDFSPKQSDCLGFQTDDQFTVLDDRVDSAGDWLLVQNGFGEIGYVPHNYVARDDVAHTEVLKSVDRAIETIHYAAASSGDIYTQQQRVNLQKLIDHRKKVVEEQRSQRTPSTSSAVPAQPKRQAPPAPMPQTASETKQNHAGAQPAGKSIKRSAPPPPKRNSSLPPTTTIASAIAVPTQSNNDSAKDGSPGVQHCRTPSDEYDGDSAIYINVRTSNVIVNHSDILQETASLSSIVPVDKSPSSSSSSSDGGSTTIAHPAYKPQSNQYSNHISSPITQEHLPILISQSGSTNMTLTREKTSPITISTSPKAITVCPDLNLSISPGSRLNASHDGLMNGRDRLSSGSTRSYSSQESVVSMRERADEVIPSPSKSLVKALGNLTVPASLGPELIERVRRNTGLSYDKSKVAIETVLCLIGDRLPVMVNVMDRVKIYMQELCPAHLYLSSTQTSLVSLNFLNINFQKTIQPDEVISLENSHDAQRLEVIFSELCACKEDSQQRSWALHEDESIILEYLHELLSILNNAKPSICRQVISRDGYEAVLNLVQYYQMETRQSIRSPLLKVFGGLCGLDRVIISVLLFSILPLELARELQTCTAVQHCNFVALLLMMTLSTGEPVPINHYEHLNETFIKFLLDGIECPLASDTADQLPDMYTSLILAFNLHFQHREDNLLLKVLSQLEESKTFTEKVMILVNREDDPVRIFDHKPYVRNSVLKFLCDLFSSITTAGVLYTNDAMVLIDIIIRQLTNLAPADKIRTEYLQLAYLMLKYSPYNEHQHRCGELEACLGSILIEEPETPADRDIVLLILREFPMYFDKLPQYSVINRKKQTSV